MEKSTEDILKKYGSKIEEKIGNFNNQKNPQQKVSQSYESFKKAMSPEFTRYEKFCKGLGKSIKIKVNQKDQTEIQKDIEQAHLNVLPEEVMGLSVIAMIVSLFAGLLVFILSYILTGNMSLFFLVLVLGFSVFLFSFLSKTPKRLALKWRLKASKQMVPSIL